MHVLCCQLACVYTAHTTVITLRSQPLLNLSVIASCCAVLPNNDKWSKYLTKRPHRRRTWTVQWYLPGCASVHPTLTHTSMDPPKSITQTASQLSQPFLHNSWQSVVGQHAPLDMYPQLIHFLGHIRVHTTKWHHHWFSRFCMATEHGRFNRIRQVTPMCTSCNTCFLGPTVVQIPNGIWIGSAIFAQLKAVSLYFTTGRPFPLKIAPCHDSLGHPSQQPKCRLDWFSHFCIAHHRASLYGNWTTRRYANSRIANCSVRGLDKSRTEQLAD